MITDTTTEEELKKAVQDAARSWHKSREDAYRQAVARSKSSSSYHDRRYAAQAQIMADEHARLASLIK